MSNSSGQPEEDYVDYTDHASYKAGVVIWKVVPPILILMGTIGNILSIYVLTRKAIRVSTTAFYLTVLAFSDLVVLYSGLMRQWLIYLFDTDVRDVSPAGCKINIWIVYSSLDFSAWILIVVTLERVISAWLPHRARTVCTRHSAMVFMIIIGVFILSLNAHLLYGLVFEFVYDENGNVVSVVKCTMIDPEYDEFFEHSWAWIDLCVFFAIPFSVIIVGNSLILFKVIQSQKKSRSVVVPTVTVAGATQSRPRGANTGHGRHSSMTAMLFTLNVVFLLTTSPVSIYNIGYPYWLENADSKKEADLEFWWAFTNMLQYTNNSLNFLLYCLSGTKFRREVIRLFCQNKPVQKGPIQGTQTKYTRTKFDASSHPSSNTEASDRSVKTSPNAGCSSDKSTVTTIPLENGSAVDSPIRNADTLHPDMALHIGKPVADNKQAMSTSNI